MAELPDLTVFAKTLNTRFKGKRLEKVDVKVQKKLNVKVEELKLAVEGKVLEQVTREGKTLHFHFGSLTVVRIHLMLKGEFALIENRIDPKYEILSFTFKNGSAFAVVDVLKQATTTLNPETSEVPDALNMDFAYFSDLLSEKRTLIKTLLMDQHLIRGIGNSYADEILWHAKISPISIAKSIPSAALERLFKSVNIVLKLAIKELSQENGDKLNGELKDFMKIHGSQIKQSPNGGVVKNAKIGGRITYYADEQEIFK